MDDKITVLRAMKKCDSDDKDKQITIKSCESHIERVARINTKFLLNQLDLSETYSITGHGLIKAKLDMKHNEDSNTGGVVPVRATPDLEQPQKVYPRRRE